jgi:hypothetical protein
MSHPIDQVIIHTITSAQVHPTTRLIASAHIQSTSIPTSISMRFYSTAPHVPHDPVGTSFQPRMQTPASQTQSAGG